MEIRRGQWLECQEVVNSVPRVFVAEFLEDSGEFVTCKDGRDKTRTLPRTSVSIGPLEKGQLARLLWDYGPPFLIKGALVRVIGLSGEGATVQISEPVSGCVRIQPEVPWNMLEVVQDDAQATP